jgi:hypothetical protein
MLRKSTLFALLVAFAFYLNQSKGGASPSATEDAAPTQETHPLFDAQEGQPNHIQITSPSQGTVELQRQADGSWMVKQPLEGTADTSAAEAAATQIGALRVLQEVQVPPEDAGLSQPSFTMTVGFTGGGQHTLEIGDQTPSMSGYYCRLDEGPVVIVSAAGVQSLLGLVTAPPYSQTPTPSPVPATDTPASQAGTGTPEGLPATATP